MVFTWTLTNTETEREIPACDWLTHWKRTKQWNFPSQSHLFHCKGQRHDRHGGNGKNISTLGSFGLKLGSYSKTFGNFVSFKAKTIALRPKFIYETIVFWQLLIDLLCRHIFPVLVWASTVESPAQWCSCNTATTVIRSLRAKHQGHGQLKIKFAKKNKFNVDFLISKTWAEQLATNPSQICISQLPWTFGVMKRAIWIGHEWFGTTWFFILCRNSCRHILHGHVTPEIVIQCTLSSRNLIWNVAATSGRQPASHHTKPRQQFAHLTKKTRKQQINDQWPTNNA